MIGKLNHVAIAVPDMEAAIVKYRDVLGATVSEITELPDHGVSVVFVQLENTKIELLHPLGSNSPVAGFLAKTPVGGVHHLCFEVSNLADSVEKLIQKGARVLGDGKSRIGAHGLPVVFLHPKDFDGTLIELEEMAATVELS
ncbi:MAG: methylmalonyl-CoA epimerase [Devosiaceae bacterium]|nr:methylmalonyl-CoA epimerase [Devosiaceae bacterium]